MRPVNEIVFPCPFQGTSHSPFAASGLDRSSLNRKRVQRMMHEDNLLCLRGKKFAVTADCKHAWGFYPNLARDLTLTNVSQLWLTDITYIRLREEFAYLAVVLDAYSRRIIACLGTSHP